MVIKIYGMIWAVIVTAVAVLLLTGNFTNLVAAVFGFICQTLVFIGMMGVLPNSMSRHGEEPAQTAQPVRRESRDFFPANTFHVR